MAGPVVYDLVGQGCRDGLGLVVAGPECTTAENKQDYDKKKLDQRRLTDLFDTMLERNPFPIPVQHYSSKTEQRATQQWILGERSVRPWPRINAPPALRTQ